MPISWATSASRRPATASRSAWLRERCSRNSWRVQVLQLGVAPRQLRRGLVDPRLQLLAEAVDARHHLVEVLGEPPQLVPGRDGGGGLAGAGPDLPDGLHQAMQRALDDHEDGQAHEQGHDEGGPGGQPERPGSAPRRQRIGPLQGEQGGHAAGHLVSEDDGGHHFPGALAVVQHEPGEGLPLGDALGLAGDGRAAGSSGGWWRRPPSPRAGRPGCPAGARSVAGPGSVRSATGAGRRSPARGGRRWWRRSPARR